MNGTSKSSNVNGANLDESPSKKRKVVYMDEDEDPGESLVINGRATTVNGKDHGSAKAQRKMRELQEQRKQLPITKGSLNLIKCYSSFLTL